MPDVQPSPGLGAPEGTTGSPPPAGDADGAVERAADDAPDGPLVEDVARRAEGLLAEHVPLTLLVDLVAPVVASAELADEEGLPATPWWGPGPAGPPPRDPTDDGEDPEVPVRP
ncbi:hypothetical protein [Cellulomonas sp. SLBN-39]|uniref:hypothetical protein n=1 Tax=Cellulomonas sp. SLBN-39 TaxID=2768446 RepID=UPI001151429F|nr:hypothetical protein [Cellulomonas sp. SLBN-39]TQL01008.1 hypothetical protein FBY24_0049 [Cellulomonas sp. SLBN-39]